MARQVITIEIEFTPTGGTWPPNYWLWNLVLNPNMDKNKVSFKVLGATPVVFEEGEEEKMNEEHVYQQRVMYPERRPEDQK